MVEEARRQVVRSVNSSMVSLYWLIGHRVVESEQSGNLRAGYGEALIGKLSNDLTARYGRGFSTRNLWHMRSFYLAWPHSDLCPNGRAMAAKMKDGQIMQTVSAKLTMSRIAPRFPLPWSAYIRLLAVNNSHARNFYETEAIRGGWSVRQLGSQIHSKFYERTALSRNSCCRTPPVHPRWNRRRGRWERWRDTDRW